MAQQPPIVATHPPCPDYSHYTQVTVSSRAGAFVTFSIKKQSTVGRLKKAFAEHIGSTPESLRFAHSRNRRELLDEDFTIAAAGINDGDRLLAYTRTELRNKERRRLRVAAARAATTSAAATTTTRTRPATADGRRRRPVAPAGEADEEDDKEEEPSAKLARREDDEEHIKQKPEKDIKQEVQEDEEEIQKEDEDEDETEQEEDKDAVIADLRRQLEQKEAVLAEMKKDRALDRQKADRFAFDNSFNDEQREKLSGFVAEYSQQVREITTDLRSEQRRAKRLADENTLLKRRLTFIRSMAGPPE